MNALYLKHAMLASILLLAAGCERAPEPGQTRMPEAWPNEAEVVFQNAEALKFAIDKNERDQRQLDELRVDGAAPVPAYRH